MTVQASEGIFGFGPQSAKGTLASTWYRHKANDVNLGTIQNVQYFPQEVGGGIHPTGAFKAYSFGGGVVNLHPRLENVIGWLLYAGVGQLSDMSGTPESGMTRHRFRPPDEANDMKWISLRKYVPGATGASDDVGEIVKDARVAGLRFILGAGQIMALQASFQGREPFLDVTCGASEWTWGNSYEDYQSVPLGNKGGFKMPLGGAERKATSVTVDIVNAYTTPREELIIGSYHPDDFVLQRQVMTVRWVYKWKDPVLYDYIVTNNGTPDASGYVSWSPVVYKSDFELICESPANVSGYSNPYRLRFYAQEVTWQSEGTPRLVGGGWLALPIIGTALQQSNNRDTFMVDLDNATSTYSWP